jgi:hypothetical protein
MPTALNVVWVGDTSDKVTSYPYTDTDQIMTFRGLSGGEWLALGVCTCLNLLQVPQGSL